MPIYEYECRACGHNFELIQKLSDPLLVNCPKCAQPTLKKLISPVAFRLKGTGWYETDFKNTRKTEEVSTQQNDNGGKVDDSPKQADSNSSNSSSNSTNDGTANQSTESTKRSVESKT